MKTMNYTDNIKGFRRRKVITKLDILLQYILCYIEDLEDLILHEEYGDTDWILLEELQQYYSFVWGLYCMLNKGIPVPRYDLEYCNCLRKDLLHTVTI